MAFLTVQFSVSAPTNTQRLINHMLLSNFIITAQWHVDCGIKKMHGHWNTTAHSDSHCSVWFREGRGTGSKPTADRVKSAEGWLPNTLLSQRTRTNHCSGLSHWSHMPGPQFKIDEQLQSSQTITNLRTQWQYFHITHSSGKQKREHTKITHVHLNHRVSITRR